MDLSSKVAHPEKDSAGAFVFCFGAQPFKENTGKGKGETRTTTYLGIGCGTASWNNGSCHRVSWLGCVTLEGGNACWREGMACDLSAVSWIKNSKLQQGKCRSDFSKNFAAEKGEQHQRACLQHSCTTGVWESWINAGQEGFSSLVLLTGDGRRSLWAMCFPHSHFMIVSTGKLPLQLWKVGTCLMSGSWWALCAHVRMEVSSEGRQLSQPAHPITAIADCCISG